MIKIRKNAKKFIFFTDKQKKIVEKHRKIAKKSKKNAKKCNIV